MAIKLTASAVGKYRAQARRREIPDAQAPKLYLIIQPSGAKSWALRFRRPDGRSAKMVLGRVDLSKKEPADEPTLGGSLTLRQARELANQIDRQRARGVDVIEQRKTQKRRERAVFADRAAVAFGAVVRRFIEEHSRTKTRRWRDVARLLGLHYTARGAEPTLTHGGLIERWAERPVREIDGHDIFTVIDEARKFSVPGIVARNKSRSDNRATALHAALSSAFSWMQRERLIEANPCAGVHRPPAPPARDRVLTADEMRWLWRATDEAGEPFGSIVKLLLLTGQRLNEVAGMRRDELRDDFWELPKSRTKNKRLHVVPLAPAARDVIASAPRLAGSDLVFTTTGTTPPSGWSKAKKRLDAAMRLAARKERADAVVSPWRLHDLRRTAVTGMAELGIRPDVIELCVNHASGARGGIAGVYNRSKLMDERRASLARWAEHVHGLVSGKAPNVTPLRMKKDAARVAS
jgi:integrase